MFYDGSVNIEEDDQCFTCQHFVKGVACPLLEALGMGVAELTGEIVVRNCGFYVKFERHLKVLRDAGSPAAQEFEEPTGGEACPPGGEWLPKKVQ